MKRLMSGKVHVNGKWLAQELTGTQRYATGLVRAMVAEDSLDLVLHVPANAVVPEWVHRAGIEVRRAPVTGLVFEQLYLPMITAGKLLLNFAGPAPLMKFRQLVVMHDATPFRYPQSFRRAFVLFYLVMYFVLARTARQLVTVSEFSAKELAAVLRVPLTRFLIVGCAADSLAAVEPRCPAPPLSGGHYLIVGTQARHKNLMAPLEAVAASGRTVVVVGVSGAGRVFNTTSSLHDYALIAGRLTDGELVWLYRNSQALIFPSEYEGFGLPPLEAQTLGCPVVCSNAASLPEVCGDGALYFEPGKPETLLVQLDRLESEPDLADVMRRRGAANADRFSWRRSARQIIDWVTSTASTTSHR